MSEQLCVCFPNDVVICVVVSLCKRLPASCFSMVVDREDKPTPEEHTHIYIHTHMHCMQSVATHTCTYAHTHIHQSRIDVLSFSIEGFTSIHRTLSQSSTRCSNWFGEFFAS